MRYDTGSQTECREIYDKLIAIPMTRLSASG